MHRTRLHRRARSASVFLHAPRHHLMGASTAFEILLQQSAQLRAEASSGLRIGAARSVCAAQQRSAQSNISPHHQISRAHAARADFATLPERRSALMAGPFAVGISVIPTEVEKSLILCFRVLTWPGD